MDLSAKIPFADLIKEAVRLKGVQQAQLRTQFDSWPKYFQHSLFMQDPVVAVRSKSYPERIATAESMKAAGNSYYNSDALEEAVAEYEKALAVFKYLENKDPAWKKKGIEDGDMLCTDFKCDNSEDQKRLDKLKEACYLNIAVAEFKLKEYPVCIRACDDTLKLGPDNVKALYRRAQALITPASSGALDFDHAISNLMRAYAIDEENREVQNLLRKLINQRSKQRAIDRETFSGMFNRGLVYGENSSKQNAEIDEGAREQTFQQEVDEAKALAWGFKAKGKTEFADEIRSRIALSQETRNCRLMCVDFFNPTAGMIADADKNGINLTDKKVQRMFHDLQEERRKISLSSKKHFESKQLPFIDSVDSRLESMTAQSLSWKGVDYHEIPDCEQFRETARQVLLPKLYHKEEPTNSLYARAIVVVAIAWTLLRLYTSSGLSILGQSTMNALSDFGRTNGVNQEAKVMDTFDKD